jgi:Domain of unknown function (DUF6894)
MEASAMPRFYCHLKTASQSIPDEDGSELPNAEAAYLYAFECARELWRVLLETRDDPTAYALEVVDGAGKLMFLLPLTEVLDTARKRPMRLAQARRRTKELLTRNEELGQSVQVAYRNSVETLDAALEATRIEDLEAARIQARELVASARRTCADSARIIQASCEAVERSRQLLARISDRESKYLNATSSGSDSEILRLL